MCSSKNGWKECIFYFQQMNSRNRTINLNPIDPFHHWKIDISKCGKTLWNIHFTNIDDLKWCDWFWLGIFNVNLRFKWINHNVIDTIKCDYLITIDVFHQINRINPINFELRLCIRLYVSLSNQIQSNLKSQLNVIDAFSLDLNYFLENDKKFHLLKLIASH